MNARSIPKARRAPQQERIVNYIGDGTPVICLTGKYLAALGFAPGQKFIVEFGLGRIVIRAAPHHKEMPRRVFIEDQHKIPPIKTTFTKP